VDVEDEPPVPRKNHPCQMIPIMDDEEISGRLNNPPDQA
jgi:hypothetical protein